METWSLRVPLIMPDGYRLMAAKVHVQGRDAEICEREQALYMHGFDSEKEAEAFVRLLRRAIMWAVAETGIAVEVEEKVGRATLPSDDLTRARVKFFSEQSGLPEHAFQGGIADGDGNVVYPTGRPPRFISMSANAVVTKNSVGLLESIDRGANRLGRGMIEHNLATSIDLFRAASKETRPRASFLLLITALEVLIPEEMRPGPVLKKVDELILGVTRFRKEVPQGCRGSVDGLLGGLSNLRRESSGGGLRKLVYEALNSAGDRNADRFAKRVGEFWNMRGKLVHSAELATPEESAELRELVRKVIFVLLQGLAESTAMNSTEK